MLRVIADGVDDVDAQRIVSAISARILDFARPGFDARVIELEAFKKEYGHCRVPQAYPGRLASWMSMQRQAGKDPGYSNERRAKLDAIGFVWNVVDAREERWFEELEDFRKKHGHCNVPYVRSGGLGRWAADQRMAAKKPGYPEDRRARLDVMGFVWVVRDVDAVLEKRFEELEAFRMEHGHCDVPRSQPGGLALWVATQRQAAKKIGYPEDRRARLDAMGFAWVVRDVDAVLERRFEELENYRMEHGHCNVPFWHPGNLGRWVATQRQAAKKLGYPEDRRARLDAMGFVWRMPRTGSPVDRNDGRAPAESQHIANECAGVQVATPEADGDDDFEEEGDADAPRG